AHAYTEEGADRTVGHRPCDSKAALACNNPPVAFGRTTLIVCHRHRFIFIATRQTAGTAIETELARVCCADDVVTGLANGSVKAGFNDQIALSRYRPVDWLKLFAFGARARIDEHVGAAEIRELVGADVWHSYFKFCVERDPWDKAVALHRARVRRGG